MFARTRRLLLRPGWPEDAPALAAAIAHETVARNLSRLPWPYGLAEAEAFLALPHAPDEPRFLICGDGAVIGGIGLMPAEDGARELGYWLTPAAWGRGYATEAGRAVVALAREALGCTRLIAHHHVDNPASGRVLAALGFRETGRSTIPSIARGGDAACVDLALDLRGAPDQLAATLRNQAT